MVNASAFFVSDANILGKNARIYTVHPLVSLIKTFLHTGMQIF